MHEEELDAGQRGTEGATIPEAETADLVATQQDPSTSSQTISLHVVGMTCANCVATVEKHLHKVPGVLDVRVVLETERATVKIIPNKVSIPDLKRAVEKAGYQIREA